MVLKTKDVLTLGEITADEFKNVLSLSIKLKKERHSIQQDKPLQGKTLAMIFQKPSTRTRVSFDVGMYQLGGHTLNLSSTEMQLERGESIEDTARTLSRYVDCIMARVYKHEHIQKLAKHATIPVINGLSDSFHPCQTLADFTTILEQKDSFQGIRIAWIGDGNNVCNSLIHGAALSGATISVATPQNYQPLSSVVKYAQNYTKVHLTENPIEAVQKADVVVTDTFKSIHDTDGTRMSKLFPKYQVNDSLMSLAKDDSIFLHCLPATRGSEVTASVIDGPRSVVWDEAENRLHSQKALLLHLLSDKY